jgi:hypothetical protein
MQAKMIYPDTCNTLLTEYINSTINLGTACAKYLSEGWNINLQELRVGTGVSAAKYEGEWIRLRVVTDTDHGSNDMVLSFCSDDVVSLHLPVRMVVTDQSVVRLAYNQMYRKYEEYKYSF